MAYGLLSTGFSMMPLDAQIESMEADARNELGVAVRGRFKKLITLTAYRWTVCWELAQAVYSAYDPNAAVGALLDAIMAITGSKREGARASRVALTLTGTPTTLVGVGSRASDITNGNEFETLDDATIEAVPAWAGSTGYALEGRVHNGGNVYQVTDPGTSASSGGPTGTDPDVDIVDGGVIWRWLGQGTGATDVDADCVDTGPVIAEAGDITQIETAVGGWEGVVNLLDADPGADVQQDGDARVMRQLELARAGEGPLDAIRATLLDVDDVLAVTVFHNPTDVTDSEGVPPHSVEALVQGGDDQDIWDALFGAVAAGIRTHGDEVGYVVDSEGVIQEMRFNRPEDVPIYVVANVTVDPAKWPLDGEDQVAASIVLYGDGQNPGKDAVAAAISAKGVFEVEGILDAEVLIGTAPAPGTSATVAITRRQIATYDTSRIVVNVTLGTP